MIGKKKIYPTMITPYLADGNIDYAAVRKLVDWYYECGCDGAFAVCLSSEMPYLSLDERVTLAKTVVDEGKKLSAAHPERPPFEVVASGHISYTFDEQAAELLAMAETGIDALVLVTNRFDIGETGEERWLYELDRMLAVLPKEMPLGIYENPLPYKRLLTEKMLKHIASTGCFAFIKDTCCNEELIEKRLSWLAGSGVKLFNANAQTLRRSLIAGAEGYTGSNANFHPRLYRKMMDTLDTDPTLSEKYAAYITMLSLIEQLRYPCTAKYHLSKLIGIPMELTARSNDVRLFDEYQRFCVEQMKIVSDEAEAL